MHVWMPPAAGVLVCLLVPVTFAGTAQPERSDGPRFIVRVIDPSNAGDCKMAGDIDGDGLIDAVVGGSPGEDLSWYRWPDWARTLIAQAVEQFTTDGKLADIDGDGDLDVVIADGSGGANLGWYRNPRPGGDPTDSTQWSRIEIGSVGWWCKDIEIGDFNLDGVIDVACRHDAQVMIFFQRPGLPWERVVLVGGLVGEGMASGDVDGDGVPDLVLPGEWLENPAPIEDAAVTPWRRFTIDASLAPEMKILVTDIDGVAGMEVIYSYSEGAGPVRWYTPTSGDPRQGWTGRTIVGPIGGCHTLQAGDVDQDGTVDVVVAQMHTFAPQEIIVAYNGGGAMSWSPKVIGTGGLHNGVLANFGGDGDLDLFGANWTGNPPVRLFENLGGCPVDINGDGRVNSVDIGAYLLRWVQSVSGGASEGDWNGDGVVNSNDISAFLTSWLAAIGSGC